MNYWWSPGQSVRAFREESCPRSMHFKKYYVICRALKPTTGEHSNVSRCETVLSQLGF